MIEQLNKCNICPHKCGVNRNLKNTGRCKATDKVKIALYSIHDFEEPCISGKKGSGTVFFSNCNLNCIYCQNYEISQLGKGREITIEELSNIFLLQQEKDVENINLVTPTSELEELIGKENASLIVRNPTPNASTLSSGARIGMVCGYINKMYEKRGVNVPTIDTNYILESGKKMNVQVGNFTNPINLTYGERTGACMRIGGVGSELFDFCLENKAGFHIKFSSESGEFVSRVSGFRVGNTIFLNELKCSVLDGYSDEDVVLACKTISKKIIDLSLNSTFPIDNVVVSNRFALSSSTPDTCLSISLAKDGYESPRYCDVNPNSCLLLTSSSKDPKVPFVPFKKNSSPLPVYQTKRITIKYTTDPKEINESIIRLNIINEILSGVPLNDVSLNVPNNEYLCAYIGEDFYVAIDQNSNPITYIMPMSNDKKRATTELNSSLKRLSHILKSETIYKNISYEPIENTKKTK